MNITNTRSTKFKVKAEIKLLVDCQLLRTYFFLGKKKNKFETKMNTDLSFSVVVILNWTTSPHAWNV